MHEANVQKQRITHVIPGISKPHALKVAPTKNPHLAGESGPDLQSEKLVNFFADLINFLINYVEICI